VLIMNPPERKTLVLARELSDLSLHQRLEKCEENGVYFGMGLDACGNAVGHILRVTDSDDSRRHVAEHFASSDADWSHSSIDREQRTTGHGKPNVFRLDADAGKTAAFGGGVESRHADFHGKETIFIEYFLGCEFVSFHFPTDDILDSIKCGHLSLNPRLLERAASCAGVDEVEKLRDDYGKYIATSAVIGLYSAWIGHGTIHCNAQHDAVAMDVHAQILASLMTVGAQAKHESKTEVATVELHKASASQDCGSPALLNVSRRIELIEFLVKCSDAGLTNGVNLRRTFDIALWGAMKRVPVGRDRIDGMSLPVVSPPSLFSRPQPCSGQNTLDPSFAEFPASTVARSGTPDGSTCRLLNGPGVISSRPLMRHALDFGVGLTSEQIPVHLVYRVVPGRELEAESLFQVCVRNPDSTGDRPSLLPLEELALRTEAESQRFLRFHAPATAVIPALKAGALQLDEQLLAAACAASTYDDIEALRATYGSTVIETGIFAISSQQKPCDLPSEPHDQRADRTLHSRIHHRTRGPAFNSALELCEVSQAHDLTEFLAKCSDAGLTHGVNLRLTFDIAQWGAMKRVPVGRDRVDGMSLPVLLAYSVFVGPRLEDDSRRKLVAAWTELSMLLANGPKKDCATRQWGAAQLADLALRNVAGDQSVPNRVLSQASLAYWVDPVMFTRSSRKFAKIAWHAFHRTSPFELTVSAPYGVLRRENRLVTVPSLDDDRSPREQMQEVMNSATALLREPAKVRTLPPYAEVSHLLEAGTKPDVLLTAALPALINAGLQSFRDGNDADVRMTYEHALRVLLEEPDDSLRSTHELEQELVMSNRVAREHPHQAFLIKFVKCVHQIRECVRNTLAVTFTAADVEVCRRFEEMVFGEDSAHSRSTARLRTSATPERTTVILVRASSGNDSCLLRAVAESIVNLSDLDVSVLSPADDLRASSKHLLSVLTFHVDLYAVGGDWKPAKRAACFLASDKAAASNIVSAMHRITDGTRVGALPAASVVCLSASGTDDTDPALYKRDFPVCTPDIGIELLFYRTLNQTSLRHLRGIPLEAEPGGGHATARCATDGGTASADSRGVAVVPAWKGC
jgi:hypothetical protein